MTGAGFDCSAADRRFRGSRWARGLSEAGLGQLGELLDRFDAAVLLTNNGRTAQRAPRSNCKRWRRAGGAGADDGRAEPAAGAATPLRVQASTAFFQLPYRFLSATEAAVLPQHEGQRFPMSQKFHERFELPLDLNEARRRFVNRVNNEVFEAFIQRKQPGSRDSYIRAVVTGLGEVYKSGTRISPYTGFDFFKTLLAIEALYDACKDGVGVDDLNEVVSQLVDHAEIDLGVRWRSGRFQRTGGRPS